jgi:DNA polymerase-3 subunit alpha
MPAVSLTDHANLMGAFHFIKAIKKHNADLPQGATPLKPILGCEFYVCENHQDRSRRDNGYQIVFIAKNKKGYENLSKMSSIAYTQGFYYVPRIDKKVVEQYKSDLMVLTGNLYGEVPSKILNVGDNQSEEALKWWQEQFGEDLYIELMRHQQEDEKRANQVLLQFAQKYAIKVLATNNSYYTTKAEANAHDILLCVKDGEKQATPIGRGRGYRFGFPNQEYYFKSQAEMKSLFADLPEAIINIEAVIDKVEPFDLAREVLLPKFDIPDDFSTDASDDLKDSENQF